MKKPDRKVPKRAAGGFVAMPQAAVAPPPRVVKGKAMRAMPLKKPLPVV